MKEEEKEREKEKEKEKSDLHPAPSEGVAEAWVGAMAGGETHLGLRHQARRQRQQVVDVLQANQ